MSFRIRKSPGHNSFREQKIKSAQSKFDTYMQNHVTITVNKQITTDISIEQIIDCLNEMPLPQRWNMIGKIINQVKSDQLPPAQKQTIKDWLERTLIKFK